MKVYLSGPMSGMPDHNRPAFNAMADRLVAAGYEVVNPADLPDAPWEVCLKRDIPLMLDCDALALLPGWGDSRGAKLEVHIAREVGIRIFDAQALLRLRDELLGEPVKAGGRDTRANHERG